ncbi:MAG: exodeoxyribonuclease VII large subunit [Acidiferrobacterales bacterium]|jgi:exodeoxyribonuclease VII large subunit|nr:exodeoxyribonuclease VII large subunit [Acidiferrobacterales bacterium]
MDTNQDNEIYSVSSLLRATKSLLDLEFGTVWVEGEISNLARPASGHLYFTLKDEKAQVRCALFRAQRTRISVEPENGLLVKVRARVGLYEPRGDFQLIIDTLEPAGIGALQRAFEELKLKLLNEGLFASEAKQALPSLPKRIGVITSPSGAVIHDILTTLRRRFPAIEVLLIPVPVQGAGAAEKIVEAIGNAELYGSCDALILARGGGSLEDLWAFNEEIVARAIYECEIPLVSSIGHETDFTIADFVADARAPTPTAAAEMLSPDGAQWMQHFERVESRVEKLVRDQIRQYAQRLDLTSRRLVHPGQRIHAALKQLQTLSMRMQWLTANRLTSAHNTLHPLTRRLMNCRPDKKIQLLSRSYVTQMNRLTSSTNKALRQKRLELTSLIKRLNTLNPLETLGRGFAIFYQEDGKSVIDSIDQAITGERGIVRVADGEIRCLIEETHEKY